MGPAEEVFAQMNLHEYSKLYHDSKLTNKRLLDN